MLRGAPSPGNFEGSFREARRTLTYSPDMRAFFFDDSPATSAPGDRRPGDLEIGERYRAGPLMLDVVTRRVGLHGRPLELPELSFDVLLALLRRAPAIVPQRQLMADAWAGAVVAPDTVAKRVTLLRQALNDVGRASPIIRIVRGRGYAIAWPVERLDTSDRPSRKLGSARPRIRVMTALVAVVFVGSLGATIRLATDWSASEAKSHTALDGPAGKHLELGTQDRSAPWGSEEIDPVAYGLFLEARVLRRSGAVGQSIDALQRAIDIEPRFAAAHAELAIARLSMGTRGEKATATALAQHALELDDRLPLAYAAAASAAIFVDWDWRRAEALIRQGLASAPDDAYLLAYYSFLARIQGDLEKAITLYRVYAATNVMDARSHYGLGQLYYLAGRYREAIDAYRQALMLRPEQPYARLAIGRMRVLQGDAAAALDEIRRESDEGFRLYGLVLVHTATGDTRAAEAALQQFEDLDAIKNPYWIGALHAYRGDADAAFDWFESAWRQRDTGLLGIKVDPLLADIRHDRRYHELLARLALD